MLTMDKLVALCRNRGIIFAGSELYGGLANTWDYGPVGVELKNNVKRLWWNRFVQSQPLVVGLDSSILLNPQVWEASGHVGGFSDPLIDCRQCKNRFRADNLIEDYCAEKGISRDVAGLSNEGLRELIDKENIPCPSCGGHNFTSIRKFNLMFQTHQGVTDENTTPIYLRPETAQGIFLNFRTISRSARVSPPFGVGQIGKSFRNEITPGNFIFRTREFEQMELEFFTPPAEANTWYQYWCEECMSFLLDLGVKKDNLRMRAHTPEELSHYSVATSDIEYLFPFGWGEIWGIANRTDYDLKAHMEYSGKDLFAADPVTNEKYIPYVVEPSVGVERLLLMFLADAYDEEELEDGSTRVLLRLHPLLAPVKIGILPLSKKLTSQAEEIRRRLAPLYNVELDDRGSIGKRYRRFDEIGTPYCLTVDFQTEEDGCVTIRDRDTMEQIRLPLDELESYFAEKFRI
ncbi:MAG: glycine--tRNA ligase [Tissierellia bacterium]|nr:glycine--tRNA ligase [Tissierellia bacterium]